MWLTAVAVHKERIKSHDFFMENCEKPQDFIAAVKRFVKNLRADSGHVRGGDEDPRAEEQRALHGPAADARVLRHADGAGGGAGPRAAEARASRAWIVLLATCTSVRGVFNDVHV